MNIESLESKRAEIRASMSPDMSMSAFKVAQAKADLIALAISRIQVAEAVKAERERIYALIDSNPEHIWRDAGFAQWRERRAKEQQQ